MTKETLAAMLNGREYREEITKPEAEQAKTAGLLVVFGASDDNLEFRGAIYEEIGAWNGTTAVLYKGSKYWDVIVDEREAIRDLALDADLVSALTAQKAGQKVQAIWAPKQPDASWLITTTLPHASFDIMEDDELYCRGLVIDTADLS